MTESGDDTIRLGDRYELGGLLGRGGMADVRIGQDLRLGRTVAIKQLRPDLSSDDTFQARFRREAQSAAALNHPAIVAVYDTGDAMDVHGNHIPYIVMEYVEGQTLREILNDDRKILPERALSITADVLSALDYSHRSGIIHRDIKPANVMLTPSGQVKVMDFGIARAIADSSSAMTATAAVIGTAQYLSPEQARGETVDARSDIYSTGCLLYELLTGRPPFVGESPVSVAYQHVREEARPPSQLNPDVSSTVDNIVARSLAKRTDDRYQSAADMRHDLERAIAGQQVDAPAAATQGGGTAVGMGALAGLGGGLGATQVGGTRVAEPRSHRDDDDEPSEDDSRKWWAYAILGILLLGALAFGIYQLTQPEEAPQVEVTDVVGEEFDVAKRALENDGFTVAEAVEETSEDVPEGEVISQNPEAGTKADEGSEVELTVSSGAGQVTIPQLTGFTVQRGQGAAGERQVRPRGQEERAGEQRARERGHQQQPARRHRGRQGFHRDLAGLGRPGHGAEPRGPGRKGRQGRPQGRRTEGVDHRGTVAATRGHRHRTVGAAGAAASTWNHDRAHGLLRPRRRRRRRRTHRWWRRGRHRHRR